MTDKQKLKNHETAIIKLMASIERMANVFRPLLTPDMEREFFKAIELNETIADSLRKES